jgi:hypothetical protein
MTLIDDLLNQITLLEGKVEDDPDLQSTIEAIEEAIVMLSMFGYPDLLVNAADVVDEE